MHSLFGTTRICSKSPIQVSYRCIKTTLCFIWNFIFSQALVVLQQRCLQFQCFILITVKTLYMESYQVWQSIDVGVIKEQCISEGASCAQRGSHVFYNHTYSQCASDMAFNSGYLLRQEDKYHSGPNMKRAGDKIKYYCQLLVYCP